MAVTRGATISTFTATVTTTTVSDAHTVDTSTTLLVLMIALQAGESVTVAPTWNAGAEAFSLVNATTASGSNNDQRIYLYALISPTVKTDNIAYTVSSTATVASVAVNYLGTLVGRVQRAITLVESVVNDGGSSTTVFASGGAAGQTGFICGCAKGNDTSPASNASGFTELADGSTGTSNTADQGFYVADDIGAGVQAVTITWGSSDENAGIYCVIADAITPSDLDDWQIPYGITEGSAGGFSRPGPYAIGSYLYMAGRVVGSAFLINVWRCLLTSDPTTLTNWEVEDAGLSGITAPRDTGCIAMIVDGTDLHCAWIEVIGAVNTDCDVWYAIFDTTTGLWGTVELIDTATSVYAAGTQVDIAIRSDGDVIVTYGSENVTSLSYDSVHYARRESGVWTHSIVLAADAATTDYTSAGCVMGASDRTHFAWSSAGGVVHAARTLTSANTLNAAFVPNGASGGTTVDICHSNMLVLGDGKIGLVSAAGANSYPYLTTWDDADSPTPNSTVAIDGTSFVIAASNQAQYSGIYCFYLALDPDNDDLYLVSQETTTGEVYYYKSTDDGATWDAKVLLRTMTSDPRLMCSGIYDNGTDWILGLAHVDDAGVTFYGETILRSSGVGATQAEDEMTLLGCGGGG